jgi:prophage tail gpP-like protein
MNEPLRLLVGGHVHDEWESYRIDSDLLSPADDWSMTVSAAAGQNLPDFVFEGAPISLRLGDDELLSGLIDSIDESVDKHSVSAELYGRDRASLLLDCSAPMLSLQLATLEQIVGKAVQPLGIKKVEYRAKPAAPRQKVHTEPGQNVWEWLQAACEANQVWPWMAADGTLVIGRPDYTTPPVADLILRRDGAGNNVLRLQRTRSLHQSYSQITVLGQSAGEGEVGHHNIKGTATDDTVPLYRPLTVVDGNCESTELAVHRATKLMADSKMQREQLVASVEGHRVTTTAGPGKPWAPGMRVNVLSEPHGIAAVYFIIRRTFTRSRAAGAGTELHLIPDGTWLLPMPFVKAKRRSSYGKRRGAYADGDDD